VSARNLPAGEGSVACPASPLPKDGKSAAGSSQALLLEEGSAPRAFPLLPAGEEAIAARECVRTLSDHIEDGEELQELEIMDDAGVPHHMYIPTSIMVMFTEALAQIGEGGAVKILSAPVELTAQQAEEVIGYPRSHLVELFGDGEVPSYEMGTNQRVPYRDVIECKDQIEAKLGEEFLDLVRIGQEMNLAHD